MAAGAGTAGSGNDGDAGAFAADEAITSEDLRFDAFCELVGFCLKFSNAAFDGSGFGIDFFFALFDGFSESIAIFAFFGVHFFSFVQSILKFTDFVFSLSNNFFEIFDFAFAGGIIAGIGHGIEFSIGMFVTFVSLFELAAFVVEAVTRIFQISGLCIKGLFEFGESVQIDFDVFTFFFDIKTKGFLC